MTTVSSKKQLDDEGVQLSEIGTATGSGEGVVKRVETRVEYALAR